MCVLRVIVWPETWSLSMACVVGVPCVCTFDRHIICMCSRNTQEPSLLSERAAQRAHELGRAVSPAAPAHGRRGGPDRNRPRATLDEGR